MAASDPGRSQLSGARLLRDPHFNKGTAFTAQERKDLGLTGLLPSRIHTLEEQVKRAFQQYQTHRTPLGKNTFMTSMKEQNEVLYYRLLQDHLKEMFSIIYTPTEGDAIADYSRIFRRSEGCFLDVENPDSIEASLAQWQHKDVDIIACSDGEQILGIGDQGVGAILISSAKLVLYTACAGVDPNRTLPVVLDVGTDNDRLLSDELYIGLQKPRVRGEKYDAFVDRFLKACRKLYPQAYVHFEDFGFTNARRILDKYSQQFACFNDDIQGTGCVTLAAIYAGLEAAGDTTMKDIRVVVFGAGSAGMGIADQIRDAIAVEGGKSREEASKQVWCVDKKGILLQSQEGLSDAQRGYSKPDEDWSNSGSSLLEVVKAVKPHVLIGTSTTPKSFTKEVVQQMAKHVKRPIIFPLSNPTRLHEAEPKDLVQWTDGKVLVATGSPFPAVEHDGRKREIAECNNSVCFPGIGLGCVLSRAKLVTANTLVVATKALASQAPVLKTDDPEAPLLPDVVDAREISVHIAAAVIKQVVKDELAQVKVPEDDAQLDKWIRAKMWEPEYQSLDK